MVVVVVGTTAMAWEIATFPTEIRLVTPLPMKLHVRIIIASESDCLLIHAVVRVACRTHHQLIECDSFPF